MMQRKGTEKEFQSKYGVSTIAVMRWAKNQGFGWKANVFTIQKYKLHRAHKKLLSCLRKVRDKKTAPPVKRVEVDQDKIWDYYNSFGRLSEYMAWRHWERISTFDWWGSQGLIPPPSKFSDQASYYRYKYRNCPEFAAMERTRRRITKLAKGKYFAKIDAHVCGVLRRDNKSNSLVDMVGYSKEELARHLESKFKDGMDWDKFSDIHIDHIVPCAAFDLSRDESVRACWSLLNLQPLWARDNLSKSDRAPEHIDPAYLELLKENAPEALEYLHA